MGAPRGAAAPPADDPSSSDDTDDEDPYSGLDDKLFDALPQFVSSLAPVDEVTTELAYAPQSLDAFDKVHVCKCSEGVFKGGLQMGVLVGGVGG